MTHTQIDDDDDVEEGREDALLARVCWEVEPSYRLPLIASYAGRRAEEFAPNVYLVKLGEASRPTQRSALDTVSRMLCGPSATYDVCPWQLVRYPTLVALRALLARQVHDRMRSPATANRWLGAVRRVLIEAWIRGEYAHEELAKLEHVPPIVGEWSVAGRMVEPDEMERVLSAIGSRVIDLRDRGLLATGYAAGLRRIELSRIELSDVPEAEPDVRVFGKFNLERIVRMSADARAVLDAWLDLRRRAAGTEGRQRVFVPVHRSGSIRADGRALDGREIHRICRERAHSAGVKPFTPHDLRRSFISRMLDEGVDVVSVQKLVGHASAETTGKYDRRPMEKALQQSARLPFPRCSRVPGCHE